MLLRKAHDSLVGDGSSQSLVDIQGWLVTVLDPIDFCSATEGNDYVRVEEGLWT